MRRVSPPLSPLALGLALTVPFATVQAQRPAVTNHIAGYGEAARRASPTRDFCDEPAGHGTDTLH